MPAPCRLVSLMLSKWEEVKHIVEKYGEEVRKERERKLKSSSKGTPKKG